MRSGWLYSFWMKMIAFLLAAAIVPMLLLSAVGFVGRYEGYGNFYASGICQNAIWKQFWYVDDLYNGAVENNDDPADYFADSENSNLRVTVKDLNNQVLFSNVSEEDIYCSSIGSDDYNYEFYLVDGLPAQDEFYWANDTYSRIEEWGENAETKLIALGLLELVLLVYLARAAGRRGDGTIEAGWQEKLPLDLYFLIDGSGVLMLCALISEMIYMDYSSLSYEISLWVVLCFVAAVGVLGFWMTLCTRVKLGTWWSGTIICWTVRLCWRVVKWCWKTLCDILRGVWEFLLAIPLVWRTGVITWGIVFIGAIFASTGGIGMYLFGGILLTLVACAFSMQLRKLQKEGEALAAGNMSAQVDTKHMFWDIKCHAENLNSIGDGMAIAVEKQLKSERLKTELITNVSHDIKTPLTSIINYVDLLQHEHTKEQEEEYLNVLKRQAFKLKKLTEDLVEASKASTGNLAVNAARCSMNELLEQVTGEYGEKLSAAELTLVYVLPDEDELFCSLDSALIWRVFDNLLSNICKYAQSGTRVYLTLEKNDGDAVVTFKNTSRAALNIPAEELMERFVRGDSSRSTEGNGLGLSIARSLTELQGGTMTLAIDGDLFKAILHFPTVI